MWKKLSSWFWYSGGDGVDNTTHASGFKRNNSTRKSNSKNSQRRRTTKNPTVQCSENQNTESSLYGEPDSKEASVGEGAVGGASSPQRDSGTSTAELIKSDNDEDLGMPDKLSNKSTQSRPSFAKKIGLRSSKRCKVKDPIPSQIGNYDFTKIMLKHFTKEIMIEIISDDNLSAKTEYDVLKMLLEWIKIHEYSPTDSDPDTLLLQYIRWSAIGSQKVYDLIKETFAKCEVSKEFLEKVLEYHASNRHFKGLRTFTRPSTGEERQLYVAMESDFLASMIVILQRKDAVQLLSERFLVSVELEAAAIVKDNTLYVTGLGEANNEIWKFRENNWTKCSNMLKSRSGHCITFMNSYLFICGGCDRGKPLKDIEQYNISSDKCTLIGASKLPHRVESAACVAYKGYIFIFGGVNETNENVDYIQYYCTENNSCGLLKERMPFPFRLMKAVLWENCAILIGRYNCLIFNFEDKTWQERKQFKTDVHYFHVVLENQNIYVIGGGVENEDNEGEWAFTDEIRYIEMKNFLKLDQSINWKHHGRLPERKLVNVCASMSFGIKVNDQPAFPYPELMASNSILEHIPADCIMKIIDDDMLPACDERDILSILIRYLQVCEKVGRRVCQPDLLHKIRWADITKEHIENVYKNYREIIDAMKGGEFLNKVVSFCATGIQFEGLNTFLRPSHDKEKCLVIIGLDEDNDLPTPNVYSVSLQQKNCINKLTITFQTNVETAAIAKDNILYLIGCGTDDNEIWKYEHGKGWNRCTEMVIGRRRHCVTIVDSSVYICGGVSSDQDKILSKVEKFNVQSEESTDEEKNLLHPIENAACVAYKTQIYVFGGVNSLGDDVDSVQVFDVQTKKCSYGIPMPTPYSKMRAVSWDHFAILLGMNNCFIYDFVRNTWSIRPQYKTKVEYFGVALENQTIFIAAGGADEQCGSNTMLSFSKDIKYADVSSILVNADSTWKHHAALKFPGYVYAFATLTIPKQQDHQKRSKSKRKPVCKGNSNEKELLTGMEKSKTGMEKSKLSPVVEEGYSVIPVERYTRKGPKTNEECSVCEENFTDPRTLECGHTFCSACLQQTFRSSRNMTCPLCRRELQVSTSHEIDANEPDRTDADMETNSATALLESGTTSEGPNNSFSNCLISIMEMNRIFTVETKQAKRITGVALMGRHLYVTSLLCKIIEVFNVEDSCSRMPDITIDELSSPQDIVCIHTSEQLLFIFDTNLKKRSGQVWKYKVAKKKTSLLLDNLKEPYALSSTSQGNLMFLQEHSNWKVAVYCLGKSKFITSYDLPTDVKKPIHVVQTNDRHFFVCYGAGQLGEDGNWSGWRVSHMSLKGTHLETVVSYSQAGPFYNIAVGENFDVFISDGKSKQVIIWNSKTNETKLIKNSYSNPAWEPWKLCSSNLYKPFLLIVGHASKSIDILTDYKHG